MRISLNWGLKVVFLFEDMCRIWGKLSWNLFGCVIFGYFWNYVEIF